MLWIKNHFNLWGIYALVYDLARFLEPYRQMMRQIIGILEENNVKSGFDAGCGTGNLARYLKESGSKIDMVGMDSSPAMLAVARKKDRDSYYMVGDLNSSINYVGGAFTAVVSINSLYNNL